MNIIKCGWLSSSGEFIECEPYEHMSIAEEIVGGKVPYYVADEYLLSHGWVKIYRESFCGHKWYIKWYGFLSEPQKKYLRPIFESDENEIYIGCRDDWEKENN